MIVKNEAHIIESTLQNITSYIKFNYYVICDTGSSDTTKAVITAFFESRNIPGELYDDPWVSFGHNRTKALERAYNKTDYVLVWDADDTIEGYFRLPEPLTIDYYRFQFGGYGRSQLFNNRKRWHYVGVLHEYVGCLEACGPNEHIGGDYRVNSGRTGARSKDPEKYLKDALTLEAAYKEAMLKKDPIHERYAFYCASSYRDAGNKEKALEWYKKVLTLNNWAQEKYVSCKEIANIYDALGTMKEGFPYLIESFKYDTTRVECAKRLIVHYCLQKNYQVAYAYYTIVQPFMETKVLTDNLSMRLFADTQDYYFYLPYYMIIVASYANKPQTGIKMYEVLAKWKSLEGEWWIYNLFLNLQCYITHVDPANLVFLQDMLSYFDFLRSKGITFKIEHYDIMAKLINVYRPLLTTPEPQVALTQSKNTSVLMTITTCKRLDLFTQTMNSILKTWVDIGSVGTILCIDDDSSEDDRTAMRSLYPWLTFYMKTPQEKGHRASMNIIWNYLNEWKPTYWIHMEDDWLFYREDNYVAKSIDFLERYRDKGIRQILFNRNYAELFNGYGINGGVPLEPGFLHHEQSDTVQGRNCAYWPHYSFRPSMTLVDSILHLGNYDSPNTFFERDYANRYKAAGYTSAFFDTVCSMHIGKLTSDKTGQNAYSLNGMEQGLGLVKVKQYVINLRRRPDRKEAVIQEFAKAGISDYTFVEATDGATLEPTPAMAALFDDNDFGYRRGIIGCALSHYKLWQQLLNDITTDMYAIYEDDVQLTEGVKQMYTTAATKDLFFLGYSTHEPTVRTRSSEFGYTELEKQTYVGGTFGYCVTTAGAKKLCDYIAQNGIKHGIDYLIKLVPDLQCWTAQPHLVFSEWYRPSNPIIDSDIQKDFVGLNFDSLKWKFYRELDSGNNDIIFVRRKPVEQLITESDARNAIAFNTLGFLKSKVQFPLKPSPYIHGAIEGLYIRKFRVKMLCNWCSSKTLCDEWNKMSKGNYTWNGITIVWEGPADYYVIINKPQADAVFEPAKTIVFHMEPWCGSPTQSWGVKTWGLWAKPDPQKFLQVRSHDRAVNMGFWQVSWTYNDFKTKSIAKDAELDGIVSTICSSKYFDPGHIKRIDFLKFLEKHNIPLHVYNSDNNHNFASYQGRADPGINKEKGLIPYKYYFMCENNEEHNFITEKLWEPILCESLCFYWGCPNVADIVNSDTFVLLDMNDFEGSLRLIQTALAEHWWEKRLPAIRKEKERILEYWGFFPTLERVLYSGEKV
jgi:GR25 family glycosyltransferase involved in LPS biosynthesis/tetratricopeptide (TPR) repeat protein